MSKETYIQLAAREFHWMKALADGAMAQITPEQFHYSYHVGQIVCVAKRHAGNSWRSLSIPKGKSAAFNANFKPPSHAAQ